MEICIEWPLSNFDYTFQTITPHLTNIRTGLIAKILAHLLNKCSDIGPCRVRKVEVFKSYSFDLML